MHESYPGIAWEGDWGAGRVAHHPKLRCKDLLIAHVFHVIKIMPPVKHVLTVCVQVPVKEVSGGMVAHVAVGDEAHVGMLCSDGGEECYVVLHIPGFATILRGHVMIYHFHHDGKARARARAKRQGQDGNGSANGNGNDVHGPKMILCAVSLLLFLALIHVASATQHRMHLTIGENAV